jgi:hypothetical protein
MVVAVWDGVRGVAVAGRVETGRLAAAAAAEGSGRRGVGLLTSRSVALSSGGVCSGVEVLVWAQAFRSLTGAAVGRGLWG